MSEEPGRGQEGLSWDDPKVDVRAAMDEYVRRLVELTTTVVCHPDDLGTVQAWRLTQPYAGLVQIRESPVCPRGEMYLVRQPRDGEEIW